MKYVNLHPWNVTTSEAIAIQKKLSKKIKLSSGQKIIKKIAAVDVAFTDNQAVCVIAVFKFSDLTLLEVVQAQKKINFPYIPGLLSFREGPVILAAWEKIKIKPDVIIFDGQGICHPRRMGIATHLGILLGIPTIGCAKSRLWGVYKPPKKEKGVYSLIKDKYTQEILGAALCTRTGTKSIFVSPGYAIDLRQSIKIIMQLSTRFRIPEPLRYCHHRAEEIKKEMQK